MFSESKGMGPRIHSPSLVDEFVCDTIDGKDYAQATNEFVGKIASKFQADINIPFAYRNNVAMIMKRALDSVPNDTQAQDLNITSPGRFYITPAKIKVFAETCPGCMRITPATLVRRMSCYAEIVSVGRFMDQSCLGTPRTLDSEITIDVEMEADTCDPTTQTLLPEDKSEEEMQDTEERAATIDFKRIKEPEDRIPRLKASAASLRKPGTESKCAETRTASCRRLKARKNWHIPRASNNPFQEADWEGEVSASRVKEQALFSKFSRKAHPPSRTQRVPQNISIVTQTNDARKIEKASLKVPHNRKRYTNILFALTQTACNAHLHFDTMGHGWSVHAQSHILPGHIP